jgi:hypothetical protein
MYLSSIWTLPQLSPDAQLFSALRDAFWVAQTLWVLLWTTPPHSVTVTFCLYASISVSLFVFWPSVSLSLLSLSLSLGVHDVCDRVSLYSLDWT